VEALAALNAPLVPRTHSVFRIVALAGDLTIAVGMLYLSILLHRRVPLPITEDVFPPGDAPFTAMNILLVTAAQAISLSFFGLYGARERFREPLGRLLVPALFFQLLALASINFLAQRYSFPRAVLLLYLLGNAPLLWAWRMALDRLFPQARRRAVIVGTGPAAALIADAIARHPWAGVSVAGLVGEGASPRPGLPVLGPLEDLTAIVESLGIDEVILTPEASSWRDRISERVPENWHADLLVWPSPFETMIGRLRFRIVGDLPLLEARVRPLEGPAAFVKRLFDVAAAAALFVLCLPLLLLAILAVATTSLGGSFYRQTRVGKNGELFELWKLRTMREWAEVETGAVLAAPGDPRVTAIGRALRATRIDEIPQLWNVLKGDMSLVGPRPERPEFAEKLVRSVPGYALRHSARPGLTGLAQISGEYSTEPEIKLRYDLAYLNNWSLGLDLSILLRTLRVVLTRRGV
jgi:exopolysaccharide biosynthesis polyprenyl glycosylphosphotransferase